jgi:hypothetical protein
MRKIAEVGAGVLGAGILMHEVERHERDRREPQGMLSQFLGGGFSQGMRQPRGEGFVERHVLRDLL